jgi:hypothetical protein
VRAAWNAYIGLAVDVTKSRVAAVLRDGMVILSIDIVPGQFSIVAVMEQQ